MLRLYYSKDQGLLDHEAYLFRAKYGNVKHVRGLVASDLELILIQRNLDSSIENLIIEQYQGSLDVLDNILQYSGVNNILILLSVKPTGSILNSRDNEEWEIKQLRENTKKSYFENVLSIRYPEIKLSKEMLKLIKEKITTNASDINNLVENIASLFSTGDLDEESIMGLLGSFSRTFNNYDFLKFYLANDWSDWICFMNTFIKCDDTFNSFLYSLTTKLLELKQFVEIGGLNMDPKEVAAMIKIPPFAVPGHKEILKRYGPNFGKWLDNFIIDLYIVQFSLVYPYSINRLLIKWFLLKQRKELANIREKNYVG